MRKAWRRRRDNIEQNGTGEKRRHEGRQTKGHTDTTTELTREKKGRTAAVRNKSSKAAHEERKKGRDQEQTSCNRDCKKRQVKGKLEKLKDRKTYIEEKYEGGTQEPNENQRDGKRTEKFRKRKKDNTQRE